VRFEAVFAADIAAPAILGAGGNKVTCPRCPACRFFFFCLNYVF